MLFMIRTPLQHFMILALFALCSVACLALGQEQAAWTFMGFTGGALSIGRKEEIPVPTAAYEAHEANTKKEDRT